MIHDRRMDRKMDHAQDRTEANAPLTPIEVGLTAAIVAVEADEPRVLVAADPKRQTRAGLPFGPFDPLSHRTFEIGLRNWVAAQTAINVGYVEQLYTFGDRGRHARPDDTGMHMISVGYLALTRMSDNAAALRETQAGFEPWYRFFPWEDWRDGRPKILDQTIVPLLEQWTKSGKREPPRPIGRRERLRHCFAVGGSPWDEEKVLDRYELLFEAGLVEEARATAARPPSRGRRARRSARRCGSTIGGFWRRAIARFRAKLKYRPVVFELMPDEFTLTELQRTVEAISGGICTSRTSAGSSRRGAGRADRRDLDRDRRAAGGDVPLPPRGGAGAPGAGAAVGRTVVIQPAVIPGRAQREPGIDRNMARCFSDSGLARFARAPEW